MSTSRASESIKKSELFKLFAVLFSTLITVICIELLFSPALRLLGFAQFDRSALSYSLEHTSIKTESSIENPKDKAQLEWMLSDVTHPYLGFVQGYSGETDRNAYGFLGKNTVLKRQKDTVIVGVFGGSVAWYVYEDARDHLISELQTIPEYRGKKIEIVSVAVGGYKQPQQVLALNYIMSLGGEFDVIINIDGFNEAALPYSDNFSAQITSYFPRHWNIYSRKAIDLPTTTIMGEMLTVKQQRQSWLAIFQPSILKNSHISLLIWKLGDQNFERQLITLNSQLEETLNAQEKTFQIVGPNPPQSKEQIFSESVDVWKRSSLQMAQLAQANGARYYHVLQPNQYLPNSKVLTPTEQRSAYISGLPDDSAFLHAYKYKEAVEKVYPSMRVAGDELSREYGVAFLDMTQVFKGNSQTIYVDPCCHYNVYGTNLFVTAIVQNIRSDISAHPKQKIK